MNRSGVMVVLAAVALAGACTEPVKPDGGTATPTVAAPAPTGLGDGMYRVGTDIAPGRYASPASPAICYWARLSDATGSFDSIIANDLAADRMIVDISPTDAFFESDGCGPWTPWAPLYPSALTSFGAGTFVVGSEVSPGRYVSEATGDDCYWARLTDASGSMASIIANEYAMTPQYVHILPGDGLFQSDDCGMWSPAP